MKRHFYQQQQQLLQQQQALWRRQAGIHYTLEQRQRLAACNCTRSFFRVPASEVRYETVGYTFFLAGPDEGRIAAIIRQYKRAGWWYVARREDEGFLGFGAQTILKFRR